MSQSLTSRRPDGGAERGRSTRHCVVCGESLAGRRSDARHCSGPCRAEAARLRGILSGSPGSSNQAYRSVAERNEARRRRTGEV